MSAVLIALLKRVSFIINLAMKEDFLKIISRHNGIMSL